MARLDALELAAQLLERADGQREGSGLASVNPYSKERVRRDAGERLLQELQRHRAA
jgi:hypothetical protein